MSLPSQLVEQRPDVRQAEENLHSASAQIGIARAKRLPSFALTGDVGSMALAFGKIFSAGTGFWDVTAGVTQPIFQGGTLLDRERAARAAYVEADEQYRSTVLTAFQNVADTLHAREQDADALKAAAAASDAAKVTLDLTTRQMQVGYVSYLNLLSAEQNYQQSLINLAGPVQSLCRHRGIVSGTWRGVVEPSGCADKLKCAENGLDRELGRRRAFSSILVVSIAFDRIVEAGERAPWERNRIHLSGLSCGELRIKSRSDEDWAAKAGELSPKDRSASCWQAPILERPTLTRRGFMLRWKARSLGVAALCRYGLMLLLSSSLLLAQEQAGQPSGQACPSKPDVQAPGEQQGQAPDASPKQPPSGSQPTGEGTVAKVQAGVNAGVNKMMDLPAEWFLGIYVPSNRNLQPLNNRERVRVYVQQTYLTGASYLKRLAAAGVDQARGEPSQWGGGLGAYGERFGSRYGQYIIQNTLTSAGDAVLHYEPRYDLCRCTGFWPRTRHAMLRNFWTYNSTEVERRPQVPLYVASFGAGALATVWWRPASESPWRNGGYAVVGQAGYGAITNWLQEFALDLGRKLSRHKGMKNGGM